MARKKKKQQKRPSFTSSAKKSTPEAMAAYRKYQKERFTLEEIAASKENKVRGGPARRLPVDPGIPPKRDKRKPGAPPTSGIPKPGDHEIGVWAPGRRPGKGDKNFSGIDPRSGKRLRPPGEHEISRRVTDARSTEKPAPAKVDKKKPPKKKSEPTVAKAAAKKKPAKKAEKKAEEPKLSKRLQLKKNLEGLQKRKAEVDALYKESRGKKGWTEKRNIRKQLEDTNRELRFADLTREPTNKELAYYEKHESPKARRRWDDRWAGNAKTTTAYKKALVDKHRERVSSQSSGAKADVEHAKKSGVSGKELTALRKKYYAVRKHSKELQKAKSDRDRFQWAQNRKKKAEEQASKEKFTRETEDAREMAEYEREKAAMRKAAPKVAAIRKKIAADRDVEIERQFNRELEDARELAEAEREKAEMVKAKEIEEAQSVSDVAREAALAASEAKFQAEAKAEAEAEEAGRKAEAAATKLHESKGRRDAVDAWIKESGLGYDPREGLADEEEISGDVDDKYVAPHREKAALEALKEQAKEEFVAPTPEQLGEAPLYGPDGTPVHQGMIARKNEEAIQDGKKAEGVKTAEEHKKEWMKEAGLGYTPSEPRSLGISKEALLVRYRKYEEDRLLQDFTSVGDEAKSISPAPRSNRDSLRDAGYSHREIRDAQRAEEGEAREGLMPKVSVPITSQDPATAKSDTAKDIAEAVVSNSKNAAASASAGGRSGSGERQTSKAIEAKYEAQQAIIDKNNKFRKAEQTRVFQAKQAVAYRTSVVQRMDAEAKANELELMAQDFLNSTGAKLGQQVVAYSRSGALMAGSALARTKQTQDEGAKGAARLRLASQHALERGKMQALTTRHGVHKPAFIPIPDAIRDPYMPDRGPAPAGYTSSRSGGSRYAGGQSMLYSQTTRSGGSRGRRGETIAHFGTPAYEQQQADLPKQPKWQNVHADPDISPLAGYHDASGFDPGQGFAY